MSYFKMFEDPMYDDDGQLIDEDAEWEKIPFPFSDMDPRVNPNDFDPFATINS